MTMENEVGHQGEAGDEGFLDEGESLEQGPTRTRRRARLRKRREFAVSMLPNLMTLGNAACGVLAICKGIDALVYSVDSPEIFYVKMEAAAWLIFLGMAFDMLDGRVARMTGSATEFGGQLDSFSDLLTFGCAPALLTKILIEHEAGLVGYHGYPRLHFLAAAAFALLAILRLARFNIENDVDDSSHRVFKGLPSPAAAGAVGSALLMYLALRKPGLEVIEGRPTPASAVLSALRNAAPGWQEDPPMWPLPVLAAMLVVLGGLMVSKVTYPHALAVILRKSQFMTLVMVLSCFGLLFVAPIPILFLVLNGFWIWGVANHFLGLVRPGTVVEESKST